MKKEPREIRFCACGCGESFECIVHSVKKFMNRKHANMHNVKFTRVPVESRFCACGCGETFECKTNSDQRFIPHHHKRISSEIRVCNCGCGETYECKINSTKRFINGHASRGIIRSAEYRKRSSESRSGVSTGPRSEECKLKISKALKGRKFTEEWKKNLSKARKGQIHTNPDCKCMTCQAKKGAYKGKNNGFYGKHHSEKEKRKWLETNRRSPNLCEISLLNLLIETLPNEYEFVGDGKVWINHKNPDFMNINGQKKLIEMFGDYWHGEESTGLPTAVHECERKEIFKEAGYETLIIWEHEVNGSKTLLQKKLIEFNNRAVLRI